MENVAREVLNVKMSSFLPEHKRNLSNEFRCFVNYPSQLSSCRGDETDDRKTERDEGTKQDRELESV